MAQCQTCHGLRYVWIDDGKLPNYRPCPQCNGSAEESCCDGEDRWQPDKLDDDKWWGKKKP